MPFPNLLLKRPIKVAHAVVSKLVYKSLSRHQSIVIIETPKHGKVLLLDGIIQLATSDEYIYHEALVHPASITHQHPRKILIIGGGDGGCLREVLKHTCVKEVVLVELDPEIPSVCKEYLHEVSLNSLDDDRVRLYFEDGRKFIENTKEKFDIVLLDATCPTSPLSQPLYSLEFFQTVKRKLKKNGIIATQAEKMDSNEFRAISKTTSLVFPIVRPYSVHVPSFGFTVAFVIGTNKNDPALLKRRLIERRLRERRVSTGFFSADYHLDSFGRFLKAKGEKLVSTKKATVIRDGSLLRHEDTEKTIAEFGQILNEVAYEIWLQCDGEKTVKDIAKIISDKYKTDSKHAEETIGDFVVKMKNNNLVGF